ncbi:exopolysaccharide biosynthesis protein [Salinimonas marina]|uniref:Exopolysaccharide biosynthesis protein n=1 Tax=Salinimonas marina TaxID=2785918 RepID=A0A7S9DZP8_9ALTE|nr:exopolysaccharide biosynthesis protein [Salinimonas marina]QPG06812.1 exopolysaccharide biosynthesis protein [Salinimonas marina]
MTSSTIMDLLDKLVEDTQETVTVEDVVSSFEERGFGPLLLIPSLLVILPTGAIPGVPSICGITLFMVCIQLAAGRDHPWLPKALRERSISHDKLEKATEKSRPYICKIENLFTSRFTVISNKAMRTFIAALSAIVALSMIPLEVMPFAASLPALALTLTAVGITYRDGVVIAIGLLLQASTGILLYQVMGML